MLFNSIEFIGAFLPLTLLVYWLSLKGPEQASVVWLGFASLIFYSVWDYRYAALLLASIAFNFLIGRLLATLQQNRRAILIAGIFGNLAVLGYYKYANFLLGNVATLTGGSYALAAIALPLGISFYTFTQTAYLVDVYRDKAREPSFARYLAFVTYFPHLIAGPLLHHAEMIPQFGKRGGSLINSRSVSVGLAVFIIGLSKKLFFADPMTFFVAPIFDNVERGAQPAFFHSWAGALAYAVQIYYDFSGYTDMALGMSYMFGIRLPLNFYSPYRARSISEFWRRWHMTLSRFLREYLYFPLGGNRHGQPRRYLNLFITMILGGLWHGAAWTFVIWGALHGLYLTVNHAWTLLEGRMGWLRNRIWSSAAPIFGTLTTFGAVVVAWVFFRAHTTSGAIRILHGMSGLAGDESRSLSKLAVSASSTIGGSHPGSGHIPQIIVLLLLVASLWILPNTHDFMGDHSPALDRRGPIRSRLTWRPTLLQGLMFGVAGGFGLLQILSGAPTEFLYFQF